MFDTRTQTRADADNPFAAEVVSAIMGAGDITGSIRKGSVADLVFIEGDPLYDVADLLKVRAVMRNGRFYSVESLLEPTPDPDADPTE